MPQLLEKELFLLRTNNIIVVGIRSKHPIAWISHLTGYAIRPANRVILEGPSVMRVRERLSNLMGVNIRHTVCASIIVRCIGSKLLASSCNTRLSIRRISNNKEFYELICSFEKKTGVETAPSGQKSGEIKVPSKHYGINAICIDRKNAFSEESGDQVDNSVGGDRFISSEWREVDGPRAIANSINKSVLT